MLSTEWRVYVSAGRFTERQPGIGELAAHIRELLGLIAADEAWARYLASYELISALGIESALERIAVRDAAEFMASVATVDIVWPAHHLMDPDGARRAARRVVALLGDSAAWWTNHDAECGAVNGLTPVFDSLVAGANDEYYVLVIQVADD
ncbi:hypothetical protein [Streptomyces halstedii]|uniref:hypothetical protein n=1 Tax=Streptomyces halstedii TaxID=1944 RepID=UPI003357D27F